MLKLKAFQSDVTTVTCNTKQNVYKTFM